MPSVAKPWLSRIRQKAKASLTGVRRDPEFSDDTLADSDWDESKHPRGEHGRWADIGGSQRSAGPTSLPAFKTWFDKSKVVDDKGQPLVVYHGTTRNFDNVFDPAKGELGMHFGTAEIASGFGSNPLGNGKGRVYPAYLSLQNPLRMVDQGQWTELQVADTLMANGKMTPDEKAAWKAGFDKRWQEHDWRKPYPRQQETVKLLVSHGYDGIEYINRREGIDLPEDLKYNTPRLNKLTDEEFLKRVPEATKSYIAIHRTQIKSAIANNGNYDPKDERVDFANPNHDHQGRFATIGGGGRADDGRRNRNEQSPAFKAWFGNSKVVGKDGKPMVVYHWTKSDFEAFDLSKVGSNNDTGMWGTGFYFAQDKNYSRFYGDKLKAVYLSLQNPLIIKGNASRLPPELRLGATDSTHGEAGKANSDALRRRLLAAGYDGVIQYEKSDRGLKLSQLVAFHPNQIKSATGNAGTFDPKDPNINFSSDWDSGKHPRGEHGKFADAASGASTPGAATYATDAPADNSKKNKDAVRAAGKAWAKGASKEGRKAIKGYTDEGYIDINTALRNGLLPEKLWGNSMPEYRKREEDSYRASIFFKNKQENIVTASHIQDFLLASPMAAKPYSSYRGLRLDSSDLDRLLTTLKDAKKSGEPVRLAGLQSASLNISQAEDCAENDPEDDGIPVKNIVILNIETRRQSHIQDISLVPSEDEVLHPHGCQYTVTASGKSPKGRRMFVLREREDLPPKPIDANAVTFSWDETRHPRGNRGQWTDTGEVASGMAYHGTGHEFSQFDFFRAGSTTDNPTAQWGAFFTPEYKEAKRYVDDFHAGDGRVISARVELKTPYRMPFSEFDRFTKLDLGKGEASLHKQTEANHQKAAEFKKKLLEDGHDGIIIGQSGRVRAMEIVAFHPGQILIADEEEHGDGPDASFAVNWEEESHPRDSHGRWSAADQKSLDEMLAPVVRTPDFNGWSKWIGGLPEEQRRAIVDYTDIDAYFNNFYLRNKNSGEKSVTVDDGWRPVSESVKRQVTNIQDALLAAPMGESITSWRGVLLHKKPEAQAFEAALLAAAKTGEPVKISGFQSASLNRETASDFAGNYRSGALPTPGMMLEIHSRRHSHIADISENGDEKEILHPHGCTYRVTGVSKEKGGNVFVLEEREDLPPRYIDGFDPATFAFDPNEPRDEHGKWTLGGMLKKLIGVGGSDSKQTDDKSKPRQTGGGSRWLNSLPEQQRLSIVAYTDIDSKPDNYYLRNKHSEEKNDAGWRPVWSCTMKQVTNVQDALLAAPMGESVTSWRGITLNKKPEAQAFEASLLAAAKTGEPVRIAGFQSATMNYEKAHTFAGNYEPLFQVAVKPMPGMILEIHSRRHSHVSEVSVNKDEQEILHPHGCTYRITGVRKDRGSNVFVLEEREDLPPPRIDGFNPATFAFDPDQPRDEHGQWAASGKSGGDEPARSVDVGPASEAHLEPGERPATVSELEALRQSIKSLPPELAAHIQADVHIRLGVSPNGGRNICHSFVVVVNEDSFGHEGTGVRRHELLHAVVNTPIIVKNGGAGKMLAEWGEQQIPMPIHANKYKSDLARLDEVLACVGNSYRSGMSNDEQVVSLTEEGGREDVEPYPGSRQTSYTGSRAWTRDEAIRAVGLWRKWAGIPDVARAQESSDGVSITIDHAAIAAAKKSYEQAFENAYGGGKWNQDKQDHPALGRKFPEWGYSHGGSSAIAMASAKMLGISGWSSNPRMELESDSKEAKKIASYLLQQIAADKVGSLEPLFHGSKELPGVGLKVGDVIQRPLTATSGSATDSASYGVSYDHEQLVDKGQPRKHNPVVYAFPVGTPIAGYGAWKKEDAKEFGHKWMEALVAGTFKVDSISEIKEHGWRQLPVKVYNLSLVAPPRLAGATATFAFDPDQPRDGHGRWNEIPETKVSEALLKKATVERDAVRAELDEMGYGSKLPLPNNQAELDIWLKDRDVQAAKRSALIDKYNPLNNAVYRAEALVKAANDPVPLRAALSYYADSRGEKHCLTSLGRLVNTTDRELTGDAGQAIDQFVGHSYASLDSGMVSGIMSEGYLERILREPAQHAEATAALRSGMAPIREKLRRQFGDTLTLYRFQSKLTPENIKERASLSYTADPRFAKWHGQGMEGEVQKREVPLDDVVWVTDRANQMEFIVKTAAASAEFSADWDEDKHPRGEHGKFATAGGVGTGQQKHEFTGKRADTGGVRHPVEKAKGRRFYNDPSDWTRDQLEQGSTASELQVAWDESVKRGIDPTGSDNLYSLEQYMDAIDAESSEAPVDSKAAATPPTPFEVDEASQAWLTKLKPEAESAISDYTAGSYADMNALLRGKPPVSPSVNLSQVRQQAAVLQDALLQAPMSSVPFSSYRGLDFSHYDFGKAKDMVASPLRSAIASGEPVVLSGFQSATLDKSRTYKFIHNHADGIILEIRSRRQSCVARVSTWPEEEEVIHPHGCSYRVVSEIKRGKDDYGPDTTFVLEEIEDVPPQLIDAAKFSADWDEGKHPRGEHGKFAPSPEATGVGDPDDYSDMNVFDNWKSKKECFRSDLAQAGENWLRSQSKEVRKYIDNYGGGGYEPINCFLRGAQPIKRLKGVVDVTQEAEDSRYRATVIQETLLKAPMAAEPFSTYRGIRFPQDDATGAMDKFVDSLRMAQTSGEHVVLAGFQSSSLDPDMPYKFLVTPGTSIRPKGVVLEFRSRRQTYVASITGFPEEMEVIHPHGSSYRVVEEKASRKEDGDYVKVFVLEELEDIPTKPIPPVSAAKFSSAWEEDKHPRGEHGRFASVPHATDKDAVWLEDLGNSVRQTPAEPPLFITKPADQWVDHLPKEQFDALNWYMGSSYLDVNMPLRADPTGQNMTDEAHKKASLIQNAILSAPLAPVPVTSWRGLDLDDRPTDYLTLLASFRMAAETGDVIKLNGFSSATIDSDLAANWVGANTRMVVEIHSPRLSYVAAVAGGGEKERELLHPHGAGYKVKAIRENVRFQSRRGWSGDRTVVVLEEVEPPKPIPPQIAKFGGDWDESKHPRGEKGRFAELPSTQGKSPGQWWAGLSPEQRKQAASLVPLGSHKGVDRLLRQFHADPDALITQEHQGETRWLPGDSPDGGSYADTFIGHAYQQHHRSIQTGEIPDFTIKKKKAGEGFSHEVISGGKKAGHIAGFERDGRLSTTKVYLEPEFRGTGLFQKVLQQVAGAYPNGLYSSKIQTSSNYAAALRRTPGHSEDNDNHYIKPSPAMPEEPWKLTRDEFVKQHGSKMEKFEAANQIVLHTPGDIVSKLVHGNETLVSETPNFHSYTSPAGKTTQFILKKWEGREGRYRYTAHAINKQGQPYERPSAGLQFEMQANGRPKLLTVASEESRVGLGKALVRALKKEGDWEPSYPMSKQGARLVHRMKTEEAVAAGKPVPEKVLADYAGTQDKNKVSFADDWDETRHPRGEHGHWVDGGGGSTLQQPASVASPAIAASEAAAPSKPESLFGHSKLIKEIEKRAEGIKFVDDVIGGEKDPDELSYDEVEELMTKDEKEEMSERLIETKDEIIGEMMRNNYDAEDDIDLEQVAKDAGYSESRIETTVYGMINDAGYPEEQANELKSLVEEWYDSNKLMGVQAVDAVIEAIGDKAPPDLATKIKDYRAEADIEMEKALQEAKDQAEDNHRTMLEEDFDDSSDRREYLNSFRYDHKEEPRFMGGSGAKDVWGKDGEDDEGKDSAFQFTTASGNTYTIVADLKTDERMSDYPVMEFTFSDAKGLYGVTGAGSAGEVFSKVTAAIVAMVKQQKPPVITFTATGQSRRKLYDRMTKTVASIFPDYSAVTVRTPNSDTKHYVIAQKPLMGKIREFVQSLSISYTPIIEPLANFKSGHSAIIESVSAELDPAWFTNDGWDESKHPRGEHGHWSEVATEGRPPVTDSLAFKKWFGDSEVVDAAGKPLVVYHGTANQFDSFQLNSKVSNPYLLADENGLGLFFTGDHESAEGFAHGKNKHVVDAYLSMRAPYKVGYSEYIDLFRAPGENTQSISGEELRERLTALGYDGLIRMQPPPFNKQPAHYIVFSPTQIKSASGNRGTFDPKDPRINFSWDEGKHPRGERGEFAPKGTPEVSSPSKPMTPERAEKAAYAWAEALPPDAKKAAREYARLDYQNQNAWLRGESDHEDYPAHDPAAAAALQTALLSAPMAEQPVVTYRALNLKPQDAAKMAAALDIAAATGEPVRLAGFQSASLEQSIAKHFTNEIAREGTESIWLEFASRRLSCLYRFSHRPEREVLHPHGCTYKVTLTNTTGKARAFRLTEREDMPPPAVPTPEKAAMFAGDWNEDKHPRGEAGRFSPTAGEKTSVATASDWTPAEVVKDAGEAWSKSFDPQERRAVRDYTITDYTYINNALRGTEWGKSLGAGPLERAAAIQDILLTAPRAKLPFASYRGLLDIRERRLNDLKAAFAAAVKTGDLVKLDGFQSSSLDYDKAHDMGDHIIELRTRRMSYVGGVSPMKEEQEVLHPHGCSYRVLAIQERDGQPFYILEEAEDVPPTPINPAKFSGDWDETKHPRGEHGQWSENMSRIPFTSKVIDDSSGIMDAWGIDGKDSDGKDYAYLFTTKSGHAYKIVADWTVEKQMSVLSFSFTDSKSRQSITDAGSANEVLRKVTVAVSAMVKKEDPPVITFKAADESRKKLYDHIIKSVAGIFPDYSVVTISSQESKFKEYIAVKKPLMEQVQKRLRKWHGIEASIEPLANFSSENWDETKHPRGEHGKWAEADGQPGPSGPGWQTESKAFKAWFGNSKVVNPDGKPTVVYHGSPNPNFDKFSDNPASRATANQLAHMGIWFTSDTATADSFAIPYDDDGEEIENARPGGIFPVYLSLQNPKIYDRASDDEKATLMAENEKAFADLKKKYPLRIADSSFYNSFYADDAKDRALRVEYERERNRLEEERKFIANDDPLEKLMDDRDEFAEWISGAKHERGAWRQRYVETSDKRETSLKLRKKLIDQGYDGIILRGTVYDAAGKKTDQYMAFQPSQIKSATGNRGTFDPKDERISFSNPNHDERGRFAESIGAVKVGDVVHISSKGILASDDGFEKACQDNRKGKESKTTGPLDVWKTEDGKLLLVDGYHRFAQGVNDGVKSFDVKVVGEGYTDYHATPQKDDVLQVQEKYWDGSNDESPSGNRSSYRDKIEASPAFKAWFASSKAVDAAGKPLIVYHGTGREFDAFSPNYQGTTDDGYFGRGFYFAPDPEDAEGYGNIIMPSYLKIEKPFKVPDSPSWGDDSLFDTRDLLAELPGMPDGLKTNRIVPDGYEVQKKTLEDGDWGYNHGGNNDRYCVAPNEKFYGTPQEIYGSEEGSPLAAIVAFTDAMAGHAKEFDAADAAGLFRDLGRKRITAALQEAGYDGIITFNPSDGRTNEMMVFDQTQIKSATGNNGAFSPVDERISFNWDEDKHPRGEHGRWSDGSATQTHEVYLPSSSKLAELRPEVEANFPAGPRLDEARDALKVTKHDVAITLRSGGKLVGVARIWREADLPSTADLEVMPKAQYINIRALATSEPGYGRRLVELCMKRAAADKAGVYLNSLEASEEFYEKAGFHRGIGATYYLTPVEVASRVNGVDENVSDPDDLAGVTAKPATGQPAYSTQKPAFDAVAALSSIPNIKTDPLGNIKPLDPDDKFRHAIMNIRAIYSGADPWTSLEKLQGRVNKWLGGMNPEQLKIMAKTVSGGGYFGETVIEPTLSSVTKAVDDRLVENHRDAQFWVQPMTDELRFRHPDMPEAFSYSSDRWVAALPFDQKEAIREYTTNHYDELNAYLRRDHAGKSVSSELAKLNYHIQEALLAAPLAPVPMTTWRGVDLSGNATQAQALKDALTKANKTGDVIRLSGFQSASTDPAIAAQWSKEIVFEIRSRRLSYVKNISAVSSENEVIHPHGVGYKVVGVQPDVRLGVRGLEVETRLVFTLEEVEPPQPLANPEPDVKNPPPPTLNPDEVPFSVSPLIAAVTREVAAVWFGAGDWDEAKHHRAHDGKFDTTGEAGGTNLPPAKARGPKSYEKTVAENLAHMGTPASDWAAVTVSSTADTMNHKGEIQAMPVFDMPDGYTKAPSIFHDQDDCCHLCGHDIKNVFWIQNDAKKWVMPVGSECVTNFGEGDSGVKLAKKDIAAANRDLVKQLEDAAHAIKMKFTKEVAVRELRGGQYVDIGTKREWFGNYDKKKVYDDIKKLLGDVSSKKGSWNQKTNQHDPELYVWSDRQLANWVKKHKEAAGVMLGTSDELLGTKAKPDAAAFSDWDESKHHRDKEGKFDETDGGSGSPATAGVPGTPVGQAAKPFVFDRGPKLHKRIADFVQRAIDNLKARGVELPNKIQVAKMSSPNIVAWYDDNDTSIGSRVTVNSTGRYWKAPEENAKKHHLSGMFSTDNPFHPLFHEVGHSLHAKRFLTTSTESNLRNHHFYGEQLEQFKKEVGKYATTNGMEFVAEVFAGMVHGKTYSDRVMMVYKSLHGPDVPLRPAAEAKPVESPSAPPSPHPYTAWYEQSGSTATSKPQSQHDGEREDMQASLAQLPVAELAKLANDNGYFFDKGTSKKKIVDDLIARADERRGAKIRTKLIGRPEEPATTASKVGHGMVNGSLDVDAIKAAYGKALGEKITVHTDNDLSIFTTPSGIRVERKVWKHKDGDTVVLANSFVPEEMRGSGLYGKIAAADAELFGGHPVKMVALTEATQHIARKHGLKKTADTMNVYEGVMGDGKSALFAADWDETKHARDEHGRFQELGKLVSNTYQDLAKDGREPSQNELRDTVLDRLKSGPGTAQMPGPDIVPPTPVAVSESASPTTRSAIHSLQAAFASRVDPNMAIRKTLAVSLTKRTLPELQEIAAATSIPLNPDANKKDTVAAIRQVINERLTHPGEDLVGKLGKRLYELAHSEALTPLDWPELNGEVSKHAYTPAVDVVIDYLVKCAGITAAEINDKATANGDANHALTMWGNKYIPFKYGKTTAAEAVVNDFAKAGPDQQDALTGRLQELTNAELYRVWADLRRGYFMKLEGKPTRESMSQQIVARLGGIQPRKPAAATETPAAESKPASTAVLATAALTHVASLFSGIHTERDNEQRSLTEKAKVNAEKVRALYNDIRTAKDNADIYTLQVLEDKPDAQEKLDQANMTIISHQAQLNAVAIEEEARIARQAEIKAEQENEAATHRGILMDKLMVPEAERVNWAIDFTSHKPPRVMQNAITQAVAFIGAMARRKEGEAKVMCSVALKKIKGRANAKNLGNGMASVSLTDASIATAVHEWGHVLEFSVPGARDAARAFLDSRTKDLPKVNMRKEFQGGYGPFETGCKDNFDRFFGDTAAAYYCGKSYDDGFTEIVSMGMEALWKDPARFCAQDPEYAGFILGLLTGERR